VLSDYAERFRTGPGWTFLTGAKADIQLVRQKLGLLSSLDERLQDHSLSLMIGNQATGQWMKRSPMENPYLLATQIGSWLHNWKLAPEPGLDYANAPALRSLTRGENLFRTRCATCHGVGATDGFVRQGPDLLGVVERRDPAWLARWIREPDAMLAEKDPLASELLAAWRNVPMPNMRLEVDDVEAVLEYLRDESARVLAAEVWPSDARAAAPPDAGRDEAAPEESEADEPVPPCCQKRDGLVLGASEPLAPTPLPELERAEEAIERELTAFGSPVDAATPPEEHATRSRSLPSSLALALALTAALGLLAARLRGPDSA
jgi:mono/diheme cytochrome c family protein